MEEMKNHLNNDVTDEESAEKMDERIPSLEDQWRNTNLKYLNIYEADMKQAGRSKRTIRTNMDYADTYMNYFLFRLIGESQDLEEYRITDENRGILERGCREIGYYISYYYMHKDSSAAPYHLEVVVNCIKDFYCCMCSHGFVSRESYDYLCFTIKSELDEWMEECENQCIECYGEENWKRMRKGETYFL